MNFLRAAIVPCLFAFAAWYCVAPDYFYGYGDPDFGYLYNSLRIAEGISVWHVDHPGTILQLFGAMVIVILKLVKHMPDGLALLVTHLSQVYFSTLALSVITLLAALFLVGMVLLRRGYGWLVTLAVQLTPALFAEFPFGLVRLNAETLLAAMGLLLTAALLPFLESSERKSRRELLLLGGSIGLLLTTKANVWAIALLTTVPFFTAGKRWKDFFLVAGAAVATFLVVTIPAWTRFGDLFGWKFQVLVHSGQYGKGQEKVTTLADLARGISVYVNWENGVSQTLAAVVTFLLLTMLCRKQKIYAPVLAAFLLTVFLLLKHPATRYAVALVPTVAITVSSLARFRREFKVAVALLLICFAAYGFGRRTQFVGGGHRRQSYQYHLLRDYFGGRNASCAVVSMGSLPYPEAGLMDGSGPSSVDDLYTERLNGMFPRYFIIRPGQFAQFGSPLSLGELVERMNKFPCHIFVAPNYWPDALAHLRGLFAGEIEEITYPMEWNSFRTFYQTGALNLRQAQK